MSVGSLSSVEGVAVFLSGTELESTTDANGEFTLAEVPVGNYSAHFRALGFRPQARTDLIVRPNRITYLEVELERLAVELDGVVVVGGYFSNEESQPTSTTGFSGEEIRRAPGSAGDVSRILATLPSLAKVNDQSNSLIVRGGSPIENAFYVDNIEIPNINHFPTQGASGGPIGLLNVDLIEEVDFRAGGFGARYGNRLSSVMDISLREGNRNEFDGQLDLSFTGFGGVAEGPLFGDRGSWLISVRRSYLDLVLQMADAGTVVIPRYADFQGKLTYDLSNNHQLTLLGISGDDNIRSDSAVAFENSMVAYGDQNMWAGTLGINWRAIWGPAVSNTSISRTKNEFDEELTETRTGQLLLRNLSSERTVTLRNVTDVFLSTGHSLELGFEAKNARADFDNVYAEYTDALGSVTPEMTINRGITDNRLGLFASYTALPFDRLTTNAGARLDHSTLTGNSHISPRLSLSYELGRRTSLTGAFGVYYQSLPATLLVQNEDNRTLRDPRSAQYVIGLSHLITDNTKATVEVYRKDYANFPIDPQQPSLFVVDELFYRHGFFFNHQRLESAGKARTTGVEATVQKRLAENVYGLASASYFRSFHMGGDNTWRDRVFDNRLVLSLEGGYKPNSSWEFSGRWIYAGGPPYTPFDQDRSTALNRGVLDQARINDARYPDYHSLNIRVDKRFHFSGSNLIVYLSVWNAYNRKNVASYDWDEIGNVQDVSYQWSALPIFGLEYEF
jgi:outer membrane receptor for ferrienterochelin and colicin